MGKAVALWFSKILTGLESFTFSSRDLFVLASLTVGRILIVLLDLSAVLFAGVMATKLTQQPTDTIVSGLALALIPEQIGGEDDILTLGMLTCVLVITRSVFALVFVFVQSNVLARNQANFSSGKARQIISNPVSWENMDAAKLIHLVTEGARARILVMPMAKINIVSEVFLVLAMFATFILVDPILGSLAVGFVLVAAAIQNFIIRREIIFHSRNYRLKQIGITGQVKNLWSNRYELAMEKPFGDSVWLRLESAQNRFAISMARLIFFRGLPRYFLEAAVLVGLLVLVLGLFTLDALAARSAELGVLIAGFFRIATALSPIQLALQNITASAQMGLLDDFERRPKSDPGHSGAEPVFSNNMPIERVNFGEKIAIVGPSGSGKTTILRQLAGLAPRDGLEFLGFSIDDPTSKPGFTAFVPQDPGLYSGDLYFNLNPFRTDFEDELVDELVERFQLQHLSNFKDLMPNGETFCSGGEVQRIAIGRALLLRPELLLLDEPSSSLDAASTKIIFNFLSTHYFGALVTVTHDPELVGRFDRVVSIES